MYYSLLIKQNTRRKLLYIKYSEIILGEVGYVVRLVLLGVSVVFDAIDPAFILSCLRDMFGIHDQALA